MGAPPIRANHLSWDAAPRLVLWGAKIDRRLVSSRSGAYFALTGSTIASLIMSKKNVEKLLLAGGADKAIRLKYNQIETKEKFVASAAADGYEFSLAELDEVLKDEDMSFESEGNPRCRSIWLR